MLLPLVFQVVAKQATEYARSRSAAALPPGPVRHEPPVYVMPKPDASLERIESSIRRVEARLEQLDALRKLVDAFPAALDARIATLREQQEQVAARNKVWLLGLAGTNALTLLLVLVLLFRLFR
jgi:hypothetical protein